MANSIDALGENLHLQDSHELNYEEHILVQPSPATIKQFSPMCHTTNTIHSNSKNFYKTAQLNDYTNGSKYHGLQKFIPFGN